jgi:zinc transporter 1
LNVDTDLKERLIGHKEEDLNSTNSNHDKHEGHGDSHGGHSHGDLNMKAAIVHIIGDAIQNLGVVIR